MSPQSSATRWLVGSALALTFVVDSLRLRSEGLNRFFFRRCSALLSPREVEALSLTWFLLGVFAVLWFPGAMLPVMSILVLAVADPAAAVVGRLWGRRRLGTGTLEGSLAFFVAAAVVLIPFVGVWVALPVAAVVAAAEVAPTPVDDNAVIPVVAAACLWLLTGGL